MTKGRILLVEDDESLSFLVKDALDAAGWEVYRIADGEKALSAFLSHEFDVCVLDVMLPRRDGFDLAVQIRKYNVDVPLIFLTARSLTEDRIRGFQVGADDYVCKPFSIEEFKYRIEAVIRRSRESGSSEGGELRVAGSVLDVANLTLVAEGVSTRLTYKECQLLKLFFRHPNKVIEREVFLKTVWQDDGFFAARSMDVFVSRLRKYLVADVRLKIDNIRAVGYALKVSA